jgi:hypothetical protein
VPGHAKKRFATGCIQHLDFPAGASDGEPSALGAERYAYDSIALVVVTAVFLESSQLSPVNCIA